MNNHEENIGLTVPATNLSILKHAVATPREIEDAHKQMSSSSQKIGQKLSSIYLGGHAVAHRESVLFVDKRSKKVRLATFTSAFPQP